MFGELECGMYADVRLRQIRKVALLLVLQSRVVITAAVS